MSSLKVSQEALASISMTAASNIQKKDGPDCKQEPLIVESRIRRFSGPCGKLGVLLQKLPIQNSSVENEVTVELVEPPPACSDKQIQDKVKSIQPSTKPKPTTNTATANVSQRSSVKPQKKTKRLQPIAPKATKPTISLLPLAPKPKLSIPLRLRKVYSNRNTRGKLDPKRRLSMVACPFGKQMVSRNSRKQGSCDNWISHLSIIPVRISEQCKSTKVTPIAKTENYVPQIPNLSPPSSKKQAKEEEDKLAAAEGLIKLQERNVIHHHKPKPVVAKISPRKCSPKKTSTSSASTVTIQQIPLSKYGRKVPVQTIQIFPMDPKKPSILNCLPNYELRRYYKHQMHHQKTCEEKCTSAGSLKPQQQQATQIEVSKEYLKYPCPSNIFPSFEGITND